MSYIGNPVLTAAYLTDQFSGNGSTTSFTMSVAPATPSSILVSVSGVLQDPTTYAVVGTALNFSAAPPAGTGNISVRYLGIPASGVTTTAYRTITEFTATAGQTTFTPPSYTVGFINVYRNGVRLGAADYTATNGTTVVLATGATAGDLVTIESFYVSSVLNAIPGTAGSVGTPYLADGAVTTAKIADANVTQAKVATGVAGTGPALFATSNTFSASAATFTLCQFFNTVFDTSSRFNPTGSTVGGIPAYSFMPNVAGYYQVNVSIRNQLNNASDSLYLKLYKNGAGYYYYFATGVGNAGNYAEASGSVLVSMNGTTDYIQVYAYSTSNTNLYEGMLSASLARAA